MAGSRSVSKGEATGETMQAASTYEEIMGIATGEELDSGAGAKALSERLAAFR